MLNHKTGTRTPIQRVYDRLTYLPQMRVALANYERHLSELFVADGSAAVGAIADR